LDAATQLITSSTTAHISAIFLLLAVISYNYYVVHTQKVFILLAQRLRKVMPYYHGINFAIAYTGAVLSGFTHDLSPTVILMIPTTLFLMITEIKRYKKIRVIQLKEIEKQEEFKKFAKKIYMMQVMAIAFMYMIANIF
jgi:Cft2 family RNA processing exonuclease